MYFAVPDGHQMTHVLKFFERAGLKIDGYQFKNLNRRSFCDFSSPEIDGFLKTRNIRIKTKVIRPQDAPMLTALGGFNLAITGTDWFKEHKLMFPDSPADIMAKLGFGKVKIVAAIHESLPIDNARDLRKYLHSFHARKHFRIASEYINIADDFAREISLPGYQVIMTYGATEALIPEDAEMVVENTETGGTLKKNKLKIIHTLQESEACLIGNIKNLKEEEAEAIDMIKKLFIKSVV